MIICPQNDPRFRGQNLAGWGDMSRDTVIGKAYRSGLKFTGAASGRRLNPKAPQPARCRQSAKHKVPQPHLPPKPEPTTAPVEPLRIPS
jgi:hypothetical protein